MWFHEHSSGDTSSEDTSFTEWLRNTPQSQSADWWKMTVDVNRASQSSTDDGGCGSSDVAASDKMTILVTKIV